MSDASTPAAPAAPAAAAPAVASAAPSAPAAAALAAAPAAAAPAPGWRDTLPEDIRGDASLANFADVGALAKGYIDTKRLATSRVPHPGETAESWKAFADALRPQDANAYEISVPEGMPSDYADSFRAFAFEQGMPPQWVKAVVDWNNKSIADQVQAGNAASQADVDRFKQQYGPAKFDAKLAEVGPWLQQMGLTDDKALAELDAKFGSGNLLQFMFNMHDRIGNLPIDPGGNPPADGGMGVMTPQQADARFNELQKDASWRQKASVKDSAEYNEAQRLIRLVAQGRSQQRRAQPPRL